LDLGPLPLAKKQMANSPEFQSFTKFTAIANSPRHSSRIQIGHKFQIQKQKANSKLPRISIVHENQQGLAMAKLD